MKDFIYCTAIFVLLVWVCSLLFLRSYQEGKDFNNGIYFIWNDDEESIPPDGSFIKIEYTDENKVYIGPIEDRIDILMRKSVENQFKNLK